VPVTNEISDAPDLTRPVGICDEAPQIFVPKKKTFGERFSKMIYGD